MAQPTYPHNIDKDYAWWVEGNQIAIAYAKDTGTGQVLLSDGTYNSTDGLRQRSTTGQWLSPHEVTTIRLVTVRRGEPNPPVGDGTLFTTLAQQPEMSSQFHKALAYYIIARGYEKSEEGLKMAQLFDAKYEMMVRKGISFAGGERYYGARNVIINKTNGIL
tara:strand:- start:350 stop:835 length:486 start_codon:yes stop_codon:yes gene_type:complete